MVPGSRRWLRGPVRALRRSRVLALGLALAVCTTALVAAEHYADPSLYEYLFVPLGVGGCTYYLAHYDLSAWEQGALSRGFLRNFAMLSVPLMLVSDDLPPGDGLVRVLTTYSVVFFAVLAAVVDVLDATGDDEGPTASRGRVEQGETR